MPARQLTCALLSELSPEFFERYSPDMASGTTIITSFDSLGQLVKKIKETNRIIKEEKPIPNGWIDPGAKPIGLDGFLTVDSGYYVSPVAFVPAFISVGTELCELMSVSDEIDVGLPEHNLRMLTGLFTEIRTVCVSLLRLDKTLP